LFLLRATAHISSTTGIAKALTGGLKKLIHAGDLRLCINENRLKLRLQSGIPTKGIVHE
jgi:hypothetical protein